MSGIALDAVVEFLDRASAIRSAVELAETTTIGVLSAEGFKLLSSS
jgi:hypothetical protein